MARGKAAKEGDRNIAPNGYHYIRTKTEWRLEHHIIAEQKLGRPINSEKERVVFKDGDRHNLNPDNIEVREKQNKSTGAKRALLEAKIAELQAELDALDE